MAQLLKLEDYISRYEEDLFFYINRFKKLKLRRWNQMKREWEWLSKTGENDPFKDNGAGEFLEKISDQNRHPLSKILNTDELKIYYKTFIYQSQLKWASSTLYKRSVISERYKEDVFLKHLLKELPDTYLIFYNPVIKIKQADVQLEIIIITPYDIKIIKAVEGEENSVFNGYNKYSWLEITSQGTRKSINPILSIDRSEKFISGLLNKEQIHLPLKCFIYAPSSYVEFVDCPQHIQLIDKRDSIRWLNGLKDQLSPFKHTQFIAAKVILNQCQTTAQ